MPNAVKPDAFKQPLHIVVSEKLKQQIEAGKYAPGDRLPSEFDLGTFFEVSRTTIRHAIANLIQQGIVTTQQGKGIFVCDRQKISFPMSNPLMRFDVALQQQGYTAGIKSLRYQLVPAPRDVSTKLGLSDDRSQVYRQEKIIYADEYAIALEIDYFPESIGHRLAEPLQQGFTYSTLATHGIVLNAAKVSLESTPTTYELSEYLTAPLGMPLLVFNYLAYTAEDRPAICGQTLSRSDWTCYTSEFEL
ncbi:MAG: GntR family transcriptional regulator [Cyanobacteria bacterium P01_D01_bin.1]